MHALCRFNLFVSGSNSLIVSMLQALSHVYSWRGKSNITVGKLLIDLWRKDEMSLGVARTPQWLIKGDKRLI